ncbi:receptor [Branchiostoma belcheri]|nr:receptor [Branchiostoma belcheri]
MLYPALSPIGDTLGYPKCASSGAATCADWYHGSSSPKCTSWINTPAYPRCAPNEAHPGYPGRAVLLATCLGYPGSASEHDGIQSLTHFSAEMELPTVSSTPWTFLPGTSQPVFFGDLNSTISSGQAQNVTEQVWWQPGPEAFLVPLFFAIIMVVGLVGNYLVIYIIVKNKEMHTVTNYFILNLAVTDLSFLVFVVPFTASTYPLTSWVFGQFMCKFVIYYSQPGTSHPVTRYVTSCSQPVTSHPVAMFVTSCSQPVTSHPVARYVTSCSQPGSSHPVARYVASCSEPGTSHPVARYVTSCSQVRHILLQGTSNPVARYVTSCSQRSTSQPVATTSHPVARFVTSCTYPLTSWVFGQFMCKFVTSCSLITVTATCITLTAMSVDRYFAIVHPIKSKQWRTPRMAKVVSAGVWLGSIVGSLPMAIFSRLEPYDFYGPGEVYCSMFYPNSTWEAGYMTYTFVAAYILPVVIITACYSQMLRRLWTRIAPDGGLTETDRIMPRRSNQNAMQQKRRTTRIVLVVVVCFTVCWGPIMILNLVKSYHGNAFPLDFSMSCVKIWAHCMSFANSSVNPFVYAFMGGNFRKAFRKSFPRCFRRARVAPQGGEPYSNSDHVSLLSRRQGASQRRDIPLQPINEAGHTSQGTTSPAMGTTSPALGTISPAM